MKNLTLMSTLGCHLCEVAAEILVSTMDPARYIVEEADIADDELLMEQYALRIPVLVDETSGRELAWPFDRLQLLTFLASLETGGAGGVDD